VKEFVQAASGDRGGKSFGMPKSWIMLPPARLFSRNSLGGVGSANSDTKRAEIAICVGSGAAWRKGEQMASNSERIEPAKRSNRSKFPGKRHFLSCLIERVSRTWTPIRVIVVGIDSCLIRNPTFQEVGTMAYAFQSRIFGDDFTARPFAPGLSAACLSCNFGITFDDSRRSLLLSALKLVRCKHG